MRRLALPALLLGIVLPFIGKPVHIDDANFLALARGAAANWWRPHAVTINWQGTTERAFDVLSNPPGIGWWLAPVVHAPVWVMHLWMLPWLLLAVWGAQTLGARFAGRGTEAALLIGGSPVAVLAAQALTPDLPLLACSLAGLAGVTGNGRRWAWALLLGFAALFRYSGAALIPLAALWPLLRRDWRGALAVGLVASLPLVLLWVHDLAAYGQVHMLAMVGFQGVAETPRDIYRKLVAYTAMVGGAGVLPVLCWARVRPAGVGLVIGAVLGLGAAWVSGQSGEAMVTTLAFAAAGGAVLGGAARLQERDDAFLLAWWVGGFVFLLALRFAATRYWLPFLAPLVLVPLRAAGRRTVAVALVVTPLLALGLSVDDFELARAQQELARRVAKLAPTGLFAGHWGFQYALERAGWRPLEDDRPLPPGTLLAIDADAWPQQPAQGCRTPVARWSVADRIAGPRVHTAAGAANFHAFLVAGQPPVETYAPWGFGDDPLDVVTVVRGCRP